MMVLMVFVFSCGLKSRKPPGTALHMLAVLFVSLA